MRPRVLLVLLVLLAPLGLGTMARGEPVLDQAWMRPGAVVHLAATLGAADDASRPVTSAPLVVIVGGVTAGSVTLHWVPSLENLTVVQSATYDRASRVGPGGGALLWIGQEDIDAGRALIGEATAYVVMETPAFVQLSGGSRNYYYSAQTGLLLRAEDVSTGSALVRTLLSEGPALAVADHPQYLLRVSMRRWSPETLLDHPHPVGERTVQCAGIVHGAMGGEQACWGWFWSTRPIEIVLHVDFPFLGIGEIVTTASDALGPYLHARCTSWGAAVDPPSCERADVRSGERLAHGMHFVDVEARFAYCLNPLRGFGCDWAMEAHVEWSE